MSAELIELRARVDRLEQALDAARASGSSAGSTTTIARAIVTCVATAAVVGAIALSWPTPMRAAGPTKVAAPFAVVDDAGRVLVEVQSTPGGGRLVVYNSAQDRVAEIQPSESGRAGSVHLFAVGETKPRIAMGVNANDVAGMQLSGMDGDFTQVTGQGIVLADRDSHPVAALRQWSDSGWLKLWAAGLPKTELWTGDKGGGISIYGVSGGDPNANNPSASQGNATPPAATEAVTIEGLNDSGKMTFRGKGTPRTTLGVSADDAGLIRLEGATGKRLEMHAANGSVKVLNPSGQEIIDLGVDGSGNGILDVRHASGVGGVRLDVSGTGAGNLKIHTPPFEVKAQIGTKGEKGDMCIEGGKGLICLSGVAIKSLIPW